MFNVRRLNTKLKLKDLGLKMKLEVNAKILNFATFIMEYTVFPYIVDPLKRPPLEPEPKDLP